MQTIQGELQENCMMQVHAGGLGPAMGAGSCCGGWVLLPRAIDTSSTQM